MTRSFWYERKNYHHRYIIIIIIIRQPAKWCYTFDIIILFNDKIRISIIAWGKRESKIKSANTKKKKLIMNYQTQIGDTVLRERNVKYVHVKLGDLI